MEQNREISYRQILRIPDYRKLILSNMVNRFGDSIDSIAFTWIVYQITHSAAWSAIVFGVNFLPNVVVQPFAGAIVEKMDKKRVLIITNLLRAIVITAFVALYIFGHIEPVVMDDIKRPGKDDKIQELVIPLDYVKAERLPKAVQDTADIRKAKA